MPEFMTIAEVAELVRASDRTVYEWLRVGRLKGYRSGWRWVVTRAQVDEFLARGRGAGAVDPAPAPVVSTPPAAPAQISGLSGSPPPAGGKVVPVPGGAAPPIGGSNNQRRADRKKNRGGR